MKCRPRHLSIVLLLVSTMVSAQQWDATTQAIIREGRDRSMVMDHLDILTNRIGPRLTGSDRLIQACEWAKQRLESYGLEVRMEKWGEVSWGFNRGPWFGRMIAPRELVFTFGTDAWTPGTRGRQKGPAVLAPRDMEELRSAGETFSGKWVVEPGGRPMKRKWRRLLEDVCWKAGALGMIRSTGSGLVRTGSGLRTGRLPRGDDLPQVVAIKMIKRHHQSLVEALESGEEVVLEFDIRNWFRKGPVPLYNVIADLKGSESPDECVIVGGHIDSWDGATGTTDNGTGVASTIEAARILTAVGARPRRTIRFMLWSGEEQGLLGSAAWCRMHQDELDRISAVFVHDGGTNYISGLAVTDAQRPAFERVFAPVLELDPEMPFKLAGTKRLQGGASDHASFIAYGVPGFYWRQSGRAKYAYGWHTQNDTFDLAIPEYQRHTATVVALTAWGVANLPEKISREGVHSTKRTIPTRRTLGVEIEPRSLEVKAVRKKSAAERAGVKAGDVLMTLDGVKLKDRFVLREALRTGNPRKKLVVLRDGELVELQVVLE